MASRRSHLPAVLCLLFCAACAGASPTPVRPGSSPSALPPSPSAQLSSTSAPPRSPSLLPSIAIDEVFRQVGRLRGIELRRAISYSMASPEEVARFTRERLLVDWPLPALEREVRLLQRFGLSEPAMDLEDLVNALGLAAARVAPSPDGALTLSTDLAQTDTDLLQVVCAYERLLLRQAFPDANSDPATGSCLTNVDACLAGRALYEGDAALLAEQWQRTFGSTPPASIEGSTCLPSTLRQEASSSGLAPVIVFPADYGVDFARALYLKAGWAGVDQAYADRPLSTEQVLHPERYPKDTPRPPTFADPAPGLGAGWVLEDSGVLGEWRTRLVLSAHLAPGKAAEAAEGWDGDQYALLNNPSLGTKALVLLTRWDTVRDAHEFQGAFRTYGEDRYGPARRSGTAYSWKTPSGVVMMDVGNDQTLWIEAPNLQVADALRRASRFPIY